MLTNDQRYAIDVHDQVITVQQTFKDEKDKRRYGSMSHKLPILIRTAGLAQALAFVESRIAPPDSNDKKKQDPYRQLLKDLDTTILGPDSSQQEHESLQEEFRLPKIAREAPLEKYILLTQQVLDALVWYKRYAQSILGVDASATIEDDATEGNVGGDKING
jgi:CRISPR type III-B/RAMP module-associated protein Cmr5